MVNVDELPTDTISRRLDFRGEIYAIHGTGIPVNAESKMGEIEALASSMRESGLPYGLGDEIEDGPFVLYYFEKRNRVDVRKYVSSGGSFVFVFELR